MTEITVYGVLTLITDQLSHRIEIHLLLWRKVGILIKDQEVVLLILIQLAVL